MYDSQPVPFTDINARTKMAANTIMHTNLLLLCLLVFTGIECACVDKKSDCKEYAEGTCSRYETWAKLNCRKTCELCTGSDNCEHGWHYSRSDDSCIRVFGIDDASSRKTWNDARSFCQEKQGNLVMIKSEDKNSFINPLLKTTYWLFWIGIKNVDKSGKTLAFKYVDGNRLTPKSYTNWKFDQPDNFNNAEHCVVILDTGKWSDIGCLSKQAFICQKAVTTST